jgi:hypothetical protein
MVAIIKCLRLDGLKNRNLFFHNSGRWKSEIRVTDRVGFL